MTKRRPIIAAAFVLATLGAGIAASGVAQAGRVPAPRISTTTKAPNTIPICYAGPNCQRTKNAALSADHDDQTQDRHDADAHHQAAHQEQGTADDTAEVAGNVARLQGRQEGLVAP